MRRLKQATRKTIGEAAARLAPEGLLVKEWMALRLLDDAGICCIGDVARGTGQESGAATRLVDSLEHKGLVRRDRSVNDRRSVSLRITDHGRTALETAQLRLEGFWDDIDTRLSAREQRELLGLMERLMAKY